MQCVHVSFFLTQNHQRPEKIVLQGLPSDKDKRPSFQI